MFLPDMSLQGRPEAQGFRKLATLRGASCKFCQEMPRGRKGQWFLVIFNRKKNQDFFSKLCRALRGRLVRKGPSKLLGTGDESRHS